MNALTKAAQDVLTERERQRAKWGDTHDDEHTNDALAYGAVSYLLPGQKPMPADWSYKSKVVDREPRRDQLIKGAALALAAVEQHDRAEAKRRKPCARCTTHDYCTNSLRGCDIRESLEAGIEPIAGVPAVQAPRFEHTYCSQCGTDLGPGEHGVSSCCDHGNCQVEARGDKCECDRTPSEKGPR